MSQIELTLGSQPWVASSSARLVYQLGHYDIPTSGILKQNRQYYMFWCVSGSQSEYGMWMYVPLRRSEVRKLRHLTSAALIDLQCDLLVGRELTCAIAHHERGIESMAVMVIEQPQQTDVVAVAGKTLAARLKSEEGALEAFLTPA